jgi:hypothetical protein
MKLPHLCRIGQRATSSVQEGPSHHSGAGFRDAHDRIFGKKKREKFGCALTIIRYVNGKKIIVKDAELKSRRECGLAPFNKEEI